MTMGARSAYVEVFAAHRWTDTGVDVLEGDRVTVSAAGHWSDAGIECDAEGFERAWLRPFERMRRAPKARWFQLIGAVERRLQTPLILGNHAVARAPASGRLFLFANDVPFMHWNNSGFLRVTIALEGG